jgi:ABC-type transport system involved in multi-copper enzyme maturation permease subunit
MRSVAMFFLTIREAILRGTLLFYFATGNLIIAFFAYAIRLSPDDGTTILFLGNPMFPRDVMGIDPIDFFLIQLQRSSASAVLLFGVFAVAGLIPAMLEKGTIEVYLSKPLSRTSLLLSRAFGASAGVAANLIYFAIGIWLVFGLRLNIWHWKFLLSVLMVCVAFLFYFSVVALAGIMTKSGGFAIMFGFVYTFFSGALQMREMTLYHWWNNVIYHRTLDAFYYLTPQLSDMLDKASLIIGKFPFGRSPVQEVTASGFDIMPFVYSLLSAALLYGLAAFYFSRQDY